MLIQTSVTTAAAVRATVPIPTTQIVPGGIKMVIDSSGMVLHPKIQLARSTTIERGPMPLVSGIIVHQTGASTAASTFNSYQQPNANGAHFLIDKGGTIFQTASVLQETYHVGKLRARCIAEKRCTPTEIRVTSPTAVNAQEMRKVVPDRFASNRDAIGIELVGNAVEDPKQKGVYTYEAVTAAQNDSLRWLVGSLSQTLQVPMTEVFRHPEVSRKQPSEASTARWR